ncbi:hypothetical protein [Solidesulfovibrio sp.]|jgi:hypothetical protein
MPADPELIGRLAVAIAKMELCLKHPDLSGINHRAMKGALGAVRHVQDRLILPEEPEPRRLYGIERSLPEGDRE